MGSNRKQRVESGWVIDYADHRLFDRPTPGLGHMIDDSGGVWCLVAEGFAANNHTMGKMKPRRLAAAIRCLKAFHEQYGSDFNSPTERYRLRQVETGEIIPSEVLGL